MGTLMVNAAQSLACHVTWMPSYGNVVERSMPVDDQRATLRLITPEHGRQPLMQDQCPMPRENGGTCLASSQDNQGATHADAKALKKMAPAWPGRR